LRAIHPTAMIESQNNKSKAVILLILLSLIWGTSFILIKRGLIIFSPGELGSLRVLAASVFLLPFAFTRLKHLQQHHYPKLFASGMMGIFIPAFLFAAAQTRLESSVSGIMNSLTPICTLIIGVFVFKQQFKPRSIVGIVLGLIGTVILILSNSGGELGGFNAYAFLVVIACVLYGSNLNFVKYKITNLSALTITSVSLMLIGPLALIYLFGFTEFSSKLSLDGGWQALGFVVLLGIMSTSVATILFNLLVKISSPLFTSSVTYIIPIVAVMWGLFDGETLLIGHFIGMVAVITGVYLANKK
jgi:drug/metabolite transporter (DMT)-like permease